MKKIFILLTGLLTSLLMFGQAHIKGTQNGETLIKNFGHYYCVRQKIQNTSTGGFAGLVLIANGDTAFLELDSNGVFVISPFTTGTITLKGTTSGGITLAPIATGTAATTIQNQNVAAATITLPSATSTLPGLGLNNAWSGANTFAGGASVVPLKIGTKSNSASQGLILVGSTDNTGGIQVFCDDGGAAEAEITAPIWTRYMLTASQTSGATQTGLYAQLKTKDALTTFTGGSITAEKIYNQAGIVTLASGAQFGIINASSTLAGTMTVPSGTMFSGIDINLGGAGTVSVSGTGKSAGLIIRNKGEGGTWPNDILLQNGSYISDNSGATLGSGTGAVTINYLSASNQTIITFTSYSMTITDHTTNGAHGALKIIDFPEGMININGIVGDVDIASVTGGVSATAVLDIGMGTTTTVVTSATLGTTNVDEVAKVDVTLSGGAKTADFLNTTLQLKDGHSTAADAWLCVAIEDESCSGNGTIILNGTITITWTNLGDY